MLIIDRVYGQQNITEPVLIDLIDSSSVQRLKKINQAGASQYIMNWKSVSRFEHSLGVMLLLKKYQAKLNEQIAGLLHDVPHFAFSHVIDFVYENENHEYHELFHEHVIANSEIPNILKKYHIPQTVVHPEKFKLLEKNLPDLCADRIDYALRDSLIWQKDTQSVQAKLSGLVVFEDEFVFNNLYAAEAFATDYIKQDQAVWADPKEVASYIILAQALHHALERNMITHNDLFTDDETVMNMLKIRGDVFVQKKLSYLTPAFRIEPATRDHHHLYIKSKVRAVDPKVLIKGKAVRLSELSPKFKKIYELHLQQGEKGVYVDIFKE